MGIFSIFITGLRAIMAFFKGASLIKYVKYVSPVFAGLSFARDYVLKYWKIALIVCLLCSLAGLNWFKNREINRMGLEVAHLKELTTTSDRALAVNTRELDQCIRVNNFNSHALVAAQERAMQAEARANEAEFRNNQTIEVIHNDTRDFRGKDKDCRKLDEPLPDWFDDWLRE